MLKAVGFGWELFFKILYLIIFLVAIFMLYRLLHLLFWWFPELKNDLVPQFDTSDQDIRMAMALFFILISIMIILHLEFGSWSFYLWNGQLAKFSIIKKGGSGEGRKNYSKAIKGILGVFWVTLIIFNTMVGKFLRFGTFKTGLLKLIRKIPLKREGNF